MAVAENGSSKSRPQILMLERLSNLHRTTSWLSYHSTTRDGGSAHREDLHRRQAEQILDGIHKEEVVRKVCAGEKKRRA